ncbi:dihydropteroate synthase [Treponema sp.]
MTEKLHLLRGRSLDLSGLPLVMAIINLNEDSFYEKSRARGERALSAALKAVEDGASIIDFGGESTRPGAQYLGEAEELERVIPTIAALRDRSDIAISIDTRKAAVARAALDAGADMVNDVSALTDDPFMAPLLAERGVPVVLMHKKGSSATMQIDPSYEDVVAEVATYLVQAALRAQQVGIVQEQIIIDPGIGFGKRLEDNLDLLSRLAEISAEGYPVLVGLSRKSFLGALTGRATEDRLAASLAASLAAVEGGARILRVHDVAETMDILRVRAAILTHKRLG